MKLLPLLAGSVGFSFIVNAGTSELVPPFRVEAKGGPIDVDVGHSAPWVTDFDGDGKSDLLLGQFGEGKLRIYRNKGSSTNPKFDSFDWFLAGNGKVPSG